MNQEQYYDPENFVDISTVDEYAINAYVVRVFGWMFYGLLVTTLTTLVLIIGTNSSAAFAYFISTTMEFSLIIFGVQFVLVWVMSARVHRMNPFTAKVMYTIYAALNGITIGLFVYLFVVLYVGIATVGAAFGITCISFGIMAIYGLTTQRDLTSFGSLLFMGLIGVLIAGFTNWFLGSTMLEFLVLVGGLGLFLGIVAWKTNIIKNQYAQVVLHGENEDGTLSYEQEALASNLAIHGALTLYLTFINIFLRILILLARMKGGGGRR